MDTRFATLFIAFYIAHVVGDYWVQTDWQARTKETAGMLGRLACVLHVTTYTMILVSVTAVVCYRFDMDLSPGRVVMALILSSVTHYFSDRCAPLRRLAVACRHSETWLDNGGLGMVDQAWHMWWLGVAALIIA